MENVIMLQLSSNSTQVSCNPKHKELADCAPVNSTRKGHRTSQYHPSQITMPPFMFLLLYDRGAAVAGCRHLVLV